MLFVYLKPEGVRDGVSRGVAQNVASNLGAEGGIGLRKPGSRGDQLGLQFRIKRDSDLTTSGTLSIVTL